MVYFQADSTLRVERNDPAIAWYESHMSQSGTRTQIVFMNWKAKAFQRMEQKGSDRRETYDEAYPKIQDVLGIEVRASGDPFRTESHPPIQASITYVSRHKDSEETYPP